MSIGKTKVAIIGCGSVGSTLGYYMVSNQLSNELVLINRNEKKAWAEAQDLIDSMGYSSGKMHIFNGTYQDCADADIVVLCIGSPRKDGMTRLDLFGATADIVEGMVPRIMASGFDGIFLVVTNPVDLITRLVWRLSGLPSSRVIGTGAALDSSRLRSYLANLMDVDVRNVNAYCLGEHGDSQMIPWSLVTIGGKPFLQILKDNPAIASRITLHDVSREIAMGSYDVLKYKGATYYGIASITGKIIHAILYDDSSVIPVSCKVYPPYGDEEVFAGLPAVIGREGITDPVEFHLTQQERQELEASIQILRGYWEGRYRP